MPTLVTHTSPHLDDLAGMWLLHRFGGYRRASARFIPTNATGNLPLKKSDIAIGIGRGKFDEHKGNVGECATSLIWKSIRQKIKNPQKRSAIDELVEYVRKGDVGELYGLPYAEFSVSAAIAHIPHVSARGDHAALDFAEQFLDAVLLQLEKKQHFLKEIRDAKTFPTPWGKGILLKTSSPHLLGEYARIHGFVAYAYIHATKGYRAIKTFPDARANLSGAYARAIALEPDVDWFLHHSKQMLICGSDVSENKHLSHFSLKDLIRLVAPQPKK